MITLLVDLLLLGTVVLASIGIVAATAAPLLVVCWYYDSQEGMAYRGVK